MVLRISSTRGPFLLRTDNYGETYETSTQIGSVFEGTVAAIPGDAFSANVYCYGLMVYPQLLSGQRFVVLNWWTQKQCGGQ